MGSNVSWFGLIKLMRRSSAMPTSEGIIMASGSVTWTRLEDDLAAAIEAFLDFSRSKNLSPNTLRMYTDRLRLFREFCQSQLSSSRPADLTVQHLRAFARNLLDSGLSPKTVNITLTSVRTFGGFLVDEGIIESSPADRIPRLRMEKRSVETLTTEQVESVMNQCDLSTFIGMRNYTAVLTLLDTGLRVSELTGLRVADVDWESRLLTVMGKGRKQRLVPFGATLRRTLSAYLRRRGNVDSQDLVFVNQFGEPIDRCSIARAILALAKKAGITDTRVTPHVFRHTFARNWIVNGGDPFSLQRILGHTTQQMVSHYVSLTSEDLRNQHSKVSPAEHVRLPFEKRTMLR